ncbi:2-iminobutanoate/2-iminopropanoate deaminase [Roseovarius litoreus]|uniref:2-iminobutanoate/2-iminopropanoate deaminase n=1 Tax=Roseovarius litoreus TaxID=1155722 RepID=A0A1M7LLD7_9RHOB|nr:Rid family detoxifying hydrolase [Roseovarius litoreus]SHM78924.1 2-iminobutanoate/2-iminopropanoate deaminase [Roseovarius litoreus]
MKPITVAENARAIGPYSAAAKANGFLFTAGQMPVGRDGKIVPGGVEAQTRQIFENVRNILATQRIDLSAVVKTTVFVADLEEYAAINAIYAEEMGAHKPARSTVQVARLPMDARVEIEFVAQCG